MSSTGRGAPASRWPVGVLAVSTMLACAGALMWLLLPNGQAPALLSPTLPWWVLAPLVAAAELAVVHVQVRREAQAISLSEVPVVLALFLTTPREMLAGVLLGAGAVYVLHRRQRAAKALFNICLRAFGVSLLVLIFQSVLAGHAGMTPRSWLAALLAVSVAGTADGLLVLGIVVLSEGTVSGHDLRRELLGYLPVCAVLGVLGLLAVTALNANTGNSLLLVVAGAGVLAAHRAYAVLHDRHVGLERLYALGRSLGADPAVDDVVDSLLHAARDLLKAEVAEIVLLGDSPEAPYRHWLLAPGSSEIEGRELSCAEQAAWRTVVDARGALLLAAGRRDQDQHPLARLGHREAVTVPLVHDGEVMGVLLIAQRMGQVRTFQSGDLTMLETIAGQGTLALRTSVLLDRLGHEARHDALTRLPNRTKFGEALRELLDTQDSPGFAVMLLDLDGFKDVNDGLGHHNGDALLVHVAQQLLQSAGPEALVARLGGDEFAVLIPQLRSRGAARTTAARIRVAVAEPITLDGIEVAAGVSIGVALSPAHGTDPSELLRKADEALYAAKSDPRGVRVHQTESDTPPARNAPLALLAELRGGLGRGEVTAHFQPQAMAQGGAVYGAEALVRWNHPRFGLLPPAAFLPLIERNGLMHEVTEVVLDHAIAAAARWRQDGSELGISVNVSARSLTDRRIVSSVEAALRRHGLPPSLLTLELTEDTVMADPVVTRGLFERLRSAGVRLSVDDFGTGYSSLAYLRDLPLNELKIDRSFISRLTESPDDLIIARSIIDLATNLSLHAIAEGVEDQGSWDLLAGLGCTGIQGYLLAKPMPALDFGAWLLDRAQPKDTGGPYVLHIPGPRRLLTG